MSLVTYTRVIKFALQNFFRNIWLSIITIFIIILTLFSINSIFFINVLTQEAISTLKEKIDISVYFKPEVTPAQVRNIKEKIEKFSEIRDIRFINREDALAFFKEKHKDDFSIQESLKELEKNPLGDTLIIKAHKLEDYPFVLRALESSQYINLIQEKNFANYNDLLEKLIRITSKVKKIALIETVIFILIAILVVFNTIRIAIYTHSQEIGIMKLVGASNWFIRAPFLVEGVLYALLGTIITLILLYPFLTLLEPQITHFFGGNFNIVAYYLSHLFKFFGLELLAMIVLNTLASSIAITRYLRV